MNSVAPGSQQGAKFLTFVLGNEEYGLEILKVQEIIGMMDITRIPRTAEHIRGVINLRGKIIPIVDLRLKFGMTEAQEAPERCIIVVDANARQTGIVVDSVSEVLNIPESEIAQPPNLGSVVAAEYLFGIGKSSGRVKLLLDIERVLGDEPVVSMEGVRAGVSVADADPASAA